MQCGTITGGLVYFQADKENADGTKPVSKTSILFTIGQGLLYKSMFGSGYDVNYVLV